MNEEDTGTIDSLLQDLGDCGLFQVLMMLLLHGTVISAEWSATFMAYGIYDPGWTCYNDTANNDTAKNDANIMNDVNASFAMSAMNAPTATIESRRFNASRYFLDDDESEPSASSCDVYSHCRYVVYNKDASTIVTEWDLACDKSWITSSMISVQLGGFVVGGFLAGVLKDKMGRKPTHFWFMAFHVILNVLAALSVSWPMFTVFRFLLGITSGAIEITNFVYPMEFVTNKWRGIVSAVPFVTTSLVLFALTALLLKDWRMMHLVTAAVTAVFFFLSIFWVPESIRWLAVKGQTDKAVRVVGMISKINKTQPKSVDAIYSIAERESRRNEAMPSYSVLDIYRGGFAKTTAILTYTYVCIIVCFNIVMFGIQALSGNFYLNLVLFNLIPGAVLPSLPLLMNTVGRKAATVILLGLACACSIVLVGLDFGQAEAGKGLASLIVSLTLLSIVESHWALLQLHCVELYPTYLRSLGYSHATCLSRLGGMIAAFLISNDQTTIRVSHLVMATLLLVNWLVFFFLPGQKGKDMESYQIIH